MEIEQHQLNVSRVGVVSGLTGLSERGAGGCAATGLCLALHSNFRPRDYPDLR
jgi:hypothetical protein